MCKCKWTSSVNGQIRTSLKFTLRTLETMRSLPKRSLSALTVMNLSLTVFMSVFLVVVLMVFTFKFGIGSQKLSSLGSRRFFTNVSICSQPFSVLSIKFFAMSVGKTTHVAKLRSCCCVFIKWIGHQTGCKKIH